MDQHTFNKELLQSIDVIKQAVDNIYEINYEAITEIRSRLEYINLLIAKNIKDE